MKKFLFLVASAFLVVGGLSAQNRPTDPQLDPHRQAVEAYVEAAKLQMQAYRTNLDARVKAAPDERERLQPAYGLVKKGDELILRLRSGPPTEFDAVKAMFERNRAELERALARET
jgi:hypothetical protein